MFCLCVCGENTWVLIPTLKWHVALTLINRKPVMKIISAYQMPGDMRLETTETIATAWNSIMAHEKKR